MNQLNYEHHTFSGGEEHVKLKEHTNNWVHRIESSEDLIKLAMLRDAWDDNKYGQPSVTIPYFPYARQDRVCNKGEAHSLRVVCNMLYQMDFHKIITYDLHSDVAFAILDNLESVNRHSYLMNGVELAGIAEYHALIAPDAGALKHCYDDATALGITEVVTATKVRDLETREIIRTAIDHWSTGWMEGKRVLITDDICDGGRTFIELAKVLKGHGAQQVDLFVTHGIFMNGMGALSEYIDNVYTTNTRTEASNMTAIGSGVRRPKVINIV